MQHELQKYKDLCEIQASQLIQYHRENKNLSIQIQDREEEIQIRVNDNAILLQEYKNLKEEIYTFTQIETTTSPKNEVLQQ